MIRSARCGRVTRTLYRPKQNTQAWRREDTDAVSKQWQRAITKVNAACTAAGKAAGTEPVLLRPMRLYDYRHTRATLLLEAGVEMRVVQKVLRHSSMTFTANTYSHVRPVIAREAMTELADLVGRTDSTRSVGADAPLEVS